jgi:phosphatidylglycerophosphate synthase
MDHLLDYGFLCAIFIGYSFLLNEQAARLLYVFVLIAIGFMTSSYLSFASTNEFKITYLGFGPTEMRLVFILLNVVIIFAGVKFIEVSLPYLIPISLVVLALVIFRTQKYIWAIDMRDKESRDTQNS